jgi:hypothetical protein
MSISRPASSNQFDALEKKAQLTIALAPLINDEE